MASIRKHGDAWQVRIRRKGFPVEIKTFSTKVGAEQWARTVESKMDGGQFASNGKAEKTTFGDVIRRYMSEITPGKRGCLEETIRLTATLRLRISKLSMANLTPQAMADYRDDRLKTCQPATVVRDLAALSSIINHARREWSYTIQNPIEMIRKPAMPPGRDRVLSATEELTLLAELVPTGRRNPLMPSLVVIAIETAMRRGEILGLHWGNVDLERQTAFLPITKNGKSRFVPLSRRAVETLKNVERSLDGRVFPIGTAAMEANFLRAVRRAKLGNLHFHDLRHTGASRMANKLPNVIELAAVTGHTSLQMLKRYYHPKAHELAMKLG
jgi:integrase